MSRDWVFAYGSNMNLEDLRRWLHGIEETPAETERLVGELKKNGKVAVLENHKLAWNYYSASRNGGAANIEKRDGYEVFGVSYLVNQKWLDLFDDKEGKPYTRQMCQIKLFESRQPVLAWIYYVRPEKISQNNKWPTAEYKQIIIDGARQWGLPEDYIKELEKTPTRPSAHSKGRNPRWK